MSREPIKRPSLLTPQERYIVARFAATKWAAAELADMLCAMKAAESVDPEEWEKVAGMCKPFHTPGTNEIPTPPRTVSGSESEEAK